MAGITWSNHTIAQIIISLVLGICGCSTLWSLTWDSVDGTLSDFDDVHHAFNFNVCSVLIALIMNIVTTMSESKYTRATHYFAMGITAYLWTGMGTGANVGVNLDLTNANYNNPTGNGITRNAHFCSMGTSVDCIGINPVSFPQMNRVRMTISRGEDDELSEGQKKVFSGAFLCQLSLFVGALIPLKFSFHKDRVVLKTIFFCCTLGCGFAGTISIFSSKISSDRWNNAYAIYQSQAQVVAITYFLMATTTIAFLSTNHAVAKFTAAMAGLQGWLTLPSMLVASSYGQNYMGMDESEIGVVRLGAVLCFFTAISALATSSSVLGGTDSGDNEATAARATLTNSDRTV